MVSYDVEHGIKAEAKRKPTRPDMSSFFSALQQAVENPNRNNIHAQPTQADVATALNLYTSSLRVRREEIERMELSDGTVEEDRIRFLHVHDNMMDQLGQTHKIEGVPQSYLDELERVPRKFLKKGMTCPICAIDFVDDEYPLVVRLSCHEDHLFDLECVGNWLRIKSTCPLDRKNLLAKKEIPKPVEEDDEEEYYDPDDLYA